MTITFYAVWMLCALGAAAFAAAAAPRGRWLVSLAAGFAAGASVSAATGSASAELAGLFAAGGALLFLFSPRHAWLAAMLGGALAGLQTGLLTLAGIPAVLPAAFMAAVMAATAALARSRPDFAPDLLRDEALLVVCVLGLTVALLPSVLDGWQAASNLNVPVQDESRRAIPAWALSIVAASMLLGAGHALWSRR